MECTRVGEDQMTHTPRCPQHSGKSFSVSSALCLGFGVYDSSSPSCLAAAPIEKSSSSSETSGDWRMVEKAGDGSVELSGDRMGVARVDGSTASRFGGARASLLLL